MIRVSIDLPEGYRYRFKPVVDNRQAFLSREVQVGYGLPDPDLRILHQDTAIEEAAGSPTGRLRTPVIVYERIDGAVVINSLPVREMMAHPDVKLWLKRNRYRDFELNNQPLLVGNLHYKTLNDLARFQVGPTAGEPPVKRVTAEMAAKIRPLPVAYIDRFAALRAMQIDWSASRPIDVSFAGMVDYEVRGVDFWDEAYDKAQAATSTDFGSVIIRHRREAVRRMVELRDLRTVVGLNRAVGPGLYEPIMVQTSIALSPWGLGEYSYRDYEAIFAGSVLVKPHSDHIETFAPDLYQAHKYYVPCAPDFSDLDEVVRSIMADRAQAIELARRARGDLLAANTPERVADYFLGLFREALGREN